MDLTEKAMLVRLSVSQWTARKLDKRVTREVARQHQTSEDAGNYRKALLAKEDLKAIQKTVGAARAFHYEQSLPWQDDGARLLPSANFLSYSQKMREYETEFQSAVADFLSRYPSMVHDARSHLNGLFDEKDYPTQSQVAEKFAFAVQVDPMPNATDFRVVLSAEEVERIQRDIETRTQAATAEAMKDLWRRLHDAVAHMAEKLSATDAIYRDSLVGNLTELVGLLPRLNLTDDPDLEAMRQEVEQKLCQYHPQDLRENKFERRKAADDAKQILDAMAGYMG